jgi:hypothetical protein
MKPPIRFITKDELYSIWMDNCFLNPHTFYARFETLLDQVKKENFHPVTYSNYGNNIHQETFRLINPNDY